MPTFEWNTIVQEDMIKTMIGALRNIFKEKLESIILYGSYARGDYDGESDMDIALLLKCDRMAMKAYTEVLAELMVDLNLEYDVLVIFCCIPSIEFNEQKDVLPYYRNIEKEGVKVIA